MILYSYYQLLFIDVIKNTFLLEPIVWDCCYLFVMHLFILFKVVV